MPKIHRLSDSVASRIAAGEVVERPASLLKELLENSLDAGADHISIEVLSAGKKSLRVSDNGSGMDPEDCSACLGRHATSKIEALEDLARLRTFGFRGEALYAIAAVSKMTIASATRGASSGWRVSTDASTVVSAGPAPAVPGTTIEVRDLFFNTPARLKFLKSDAFEKSRLTAVVEEAALANPHVRFTYKSENRTTLDFEPQPSSNPLEALHKRAAAVLGADLGAKLLCVTGERPNISLTLFVSPADGLAATRDFQYWFVNRRPIAAKILQQALYRAYEELRPRDKHPVCVGHLDLSPDAFDVNVHPGKREIRFHSDREIFELVSGLIAAKLGRSRIAAPITRAPQEALLSETSTLVREDVKPYYLGGRSYFPEEPAFALNAHTPQALSAQPDAPRWFTPPYRFLGQIERSYLVFEASGGLFVLDQHAAAERILYERFLKEIESGAVKSQKLMLPIPIELPASSVQKIMSRHARLEQLGFSVEPFGKTTVHFLAAPELFYKAADLKEMLHRLLEAIEDPLGAAQTVSHDALATVACKAAVKAHDRLGPEEAMALLSDLKDCRDGSCCPHGRRAILALNREELARRFQRPGAPPL